MEQAGDTEITSYRYICSTCLSTDRNLISISALTQVFEVFRLLIYDLTGDLRLSEAEQFVCWECLAIMKRFARFKQQVHTAQDHLRMLALSRGHEGLDHTYITQTLSPLMSVLKSDFDKIYFDYTQYTQWSDSYIVQEEDGVKDEHFDVIGSHVVRNLDLDNLSGELLEVPDLTSIEDTENKTVPHIMVGQENTLLITQTTLKCEALQNSEVIEISESLPQAEDSEQPLIIDFKKTDDTQDDIVAYFMSESAMLAHREELKQRASYASAAYKCELCIVGFRSQHEVEQHFVTHHRAADNTSPCRVCYSYVATEALDAHIAQHYTRRVRQVNSRAGDNSARVSRVRGESGAIRIEEEGGRKRKKPKAKDGKPLKPAELRRLLSKTTIECYKCLECDMFFKNSRSRKNHVARFHREGLQCDHCQKRFVNKTTLATHMKLHAGPLPRTECPVCGKMVRDTQLKYHVQRHQNTSRYECRDCDKIFSHLATYQAHLKHSRAHASEDVFKFPCPMCNKGYPTKEQMLDHFNYQHLGKTCHKCPVCDKPIASRANVKKHMLRVHGEKKEKPRNHVCPQCRKAFTDKKALTQHAVIHSGARPLECDICRTTFKQKASLYTHRKRVHKVFPAKRTVELMETDGISSHEAASVGRPTVGLAAAH